MLWLTVVSAGAAIASAVFAFVQAKAATDSRRDAQDARRDAKSAQSKAEIAQAEANRIAGEAKDALSRSAGALERANEIAERSIPKDEITWRITQVGESRWMASNAGKITAYQARIEQLSGWVHTDDEEPRDVMPGDSLYFNTMSLGGEAARILIRAEERTDAGTREIRNEVTMP